MPNAFDPTRRPQLAVAPASLHALHAALGPAGAGTLQEAGYATGQAHAAALQDWLAESGAASVRALPLEEFRARLGAFFAELGWGRLTLRADGALSVAEAHDWAERQPRAEGAPPACHFTTGMLAGFFGALAEHPVAVLEVEPAHDAPDGCRFVLGSEPLLEQLFTRLQHGERADAVLAELGGRGA
jgi:predicted hydrocarbon binding protein